MYEMNNYNYSLCTFGSLFADRGQTRMGTDKEGNMSGKADPERLDLSDRELIELIKNHGTGRRSVLAALGVGTAVSMGSGVAAASHDEPHTPHVDSHYGYSAPGDERLPGKLRPDRTVELHVGEGPLPFHFDPMGIHIDAGDTVRFDFDSPDHTVTAFHLEHGRQQRVPDDAEPFSSPVLNSGGFWLYEFDHPGTYDVYCGPHQFFGMVMRLVVGDPDSDEYDDEFSEEGRPPITKHELENLPGVEEWVLPTSADIFDTDAMSVSNIVKNGPITSLDVAAEL